MKQVDCKMSTKNVNNFKYKAFRDIFGQLHKAVMKKEIVRLKLNIKKSKENQATLIS